MNKHEYINQSLDICNNMLASLIELENAMAEYFGIDLTEEEENNG